MPSGSLKYYAKLTMNTDGPNNTFIIITIVFGGIALLLACVGIGTPNWQSAQAVINGQSYVISTANFFYACRSNLNGTAMNCIHRSDNRNINQYYPINARWNQTEWNQHLDNAAGLCIVGIFFIFVGTLTTLLMCVENLATWIYLISPTGLFIACLFMLAGMAEGAYVLYYNDYAANLYQTAHLLTILSFLVSCIAAGRIFSFPDLKQYDIPIRKM
ncbi:unnamed protein product [Rotaria socialis]